MKTILSGDIGGTHARLALFRVEREGRDGKGGASRAVFQEARTFRTGEYAGPGPIVREFLDTTGARPVAASLGLAGVVRAGRAAMMNLPWTVDASGLARDLGLPAVELLNDLEAAALGIEDLEPGGEEVLHAGEPDLEGNRCLCSAGTGLGEAGLVRWKGAYIPFHSEGGHVNFAPRNGLEIDLLRHLLDRFGEGTGHVSYERVVSGPGLANIYAFLRDTGRGEEPAWLAGRMAGGISGRVITDCALAGESGLCADALEIFVSIYGSAAGNLALKTMATAGVWLGGGIAPRILSLLRGPIFRESFLSKGRLRPLLERIPVRVVTDDRLALRGAARAALRRLEA